MQSIKKIIFLLLIFLSSCSTMQEDHKQVISYLAENGALVISADAKSLLKMFKDQIPEGSEEFLSYLQSDTERLYIKITDGISIVAKGEYSMPILMSGLEYFASFEKKEAKNGFLTFFQTDDIKIGIPNRNNILYTNLDYKDEYEKIISYKREPNLSLQTQLFLEEPMFSIYSDNPTFDESLFDNSLSKIINKSEKAILRIDEDGDDFFLSGTLFLKNEDFVKSLEKLLKAQFVSLKKKRGEKIDFKSIKNMIILKDNEIQITKMLIEMN